MTPKISVIICTYGRAAALEALLNCLTAQEQACFETLIIDGNGEFSPAREVLEKFLDLRARRWRCGWSSRQKVSPASEM